MNTSAFAQIISNIRNFPEQYSGLLLFFEILGYTLSAVFVVGIVYYVIRLNNIRGKIRQELNDHFINKTNSDQTNPRIEKWKKIVQGISDQNPQLWILAIIQADLILEEVVTSMGYTGNSFGEKLRQINRKDVHWIDAAWDVHKLRNVLSHDSGKFYLNQREAYRAFKIYETILYETGYLS